MIPLLLLLTSDLGHAMPPCYKENNSKKKNNCYKRAGGSGLFLTVVHLIKLQVDITLVWGDITSAEMT